jgi:hypothetical protein
MRHASKLACTLCGLIFTLLLATDVSAQIVRGTPCDPGVRFNNPTCTRSNPTCVGGTPCGSCRRVSGTCAPGCLDGPTSAGLTFFDPFNLCNATCTSQRGQCTPAACNNDTDCVGGESCTAGLCQAKTCTTNAACGSQAHCDRSAGLCAPGAVVTPVVTPSGGNCGPTRNRNRRAVLRTGNADPVRPAAMVVATVRSRPFPASSSMSGAHAGLNSPLCVARRRASRRSHSERIRRLSWRI